MSKKHHQPPKVYGTLQQSITDAAVAQHDSTVAAQAVKDGRETVAQKTRVATAAVVHNNAAIDAADAAKKKDQVQAASVGLAVLGLLKFLPKIL